MYQNILIPTDGSDLSAKAVTHGIVFAKAIGSKVTILTVSEPFRVFAIDPEMLEDTPASYQKRAAQHATKILEAAAGAAKTLGVPCDTVHVEHAHPYEAILTTAKSKMCDLILMASHGRRGVSALVLGSETTKVLTHSKIPVLVYR